VATHIKALLYTLASAYPNLAYLVVVGAIFVAVNLIVDIIYGFVNPMVRIAGTK
jgi:ABC-type dipeptide/oligopeptide/nickel transport system permease component